MNIKRSEQRTEPRITLNKEFESFDTFVNEYVTNVSRSGAFIHATTPLPVGTQVELCFTVFLNDIETIEGIGKVVRTQDDPPGMGVVFIELTKCSQRLLTQLLTQHKQ